MSKRLLFLIALCLAQVRGQVTLESTGKEIEKAFLERGIAGVAVWSVQFCGPAGARSSAGEIYATAAARGVTLFPAAAVDAFATRAIGRSRAQRAADASEGLTAAGAVLTSTGIIKANSRYTVAFILAAGTAHWLAGKLQRQAPDRSKIRQLVLPDVIALPAGGCFTGLALGRNK